MTITVAADGHAPDGHAPDLAVPVKGTRAVGSIDEGEPEDDDRFL